MRVHEIFVVTSTRGGAASRPVGGHGHVGLVAVSERKPYKSDVSDEQ